MNTVRIERTKRGYPALWESGGGMSNTGFATIVTGRRGEALKPIYIRRRGHLACSNHALFVVKLGFYVVEADHHRGNFNIRVKRIMRIEEDEAAIELVAEFSDGEWDSPPPMELSFAIAVAKEKALCYHCREPHFIRE